LICARVKGSRRKSAQLFLPINGDDRFCVGILDEKLYRIVRRIARGRSFGDLQYTSGEIRSLRVDLYEVELVGKGDHKA